MFAEVTQTSPLLLLLLLLLLLFVLYIKPSNERASPRLPTANPVRRYK